MRTLIAVILLALSALLAIATAPEELEAQCSGCFQCTPDKARGYTPPMPDILWLDAACAQGRCSSALPCPGDDEEDAAALAAMIDAGDHEALIARMWSGSDRVQFVADRGSLAVFEGCQRTLIGLMALPEELWPTAIAATLRRFEGASALERNSRRLNAFF